MGIKRSRSLSLAAISFFLFFSFSFGNSPFSLASWEFQRMRPLSNEPASTRGRFNCPKTDNCSLQNGLQMGRALPVHRPNEVEYLPTVPFIPKRYGNEL